MTKSRAIMLLIVTVFMVSLFTGCAPARRPAPDTGPRQDMTEPRDMTRDNVNDNMGRESNRIAEQLAKEASKVNGVRAATVVYTNGTAVVGLDLEKNIEAGQTENIKQEVSNRLKKTNNNVETVSISTDADTVTRIRNIARGVAEGRPVSEFAKELSEITRRVSPSVR
jgi:YhcN/YlaJ family sporulation lipoprotein